jgi:hypothetical protein
VHTTSLADAGDWTISIHRALLNWLREHVPCKDAIHEIVIAYHSWRRHGHFSIATRRIDATASSQVRRHVLAAMRACPYIRRITSYIPGRQSIRYGFSLPETRKIERSGIEFFDREQDVEGAPTDNGYVYHVQSSVSVRYSIGHSWLMNRALRWLCLCKENGLQIACDLFGDSTIGQAVFRAIELIDFPKNRDWIATDEPEKIGWRVSYHARCLGGQMLRMLRTRRGRMYHPLTSCPRDLRSRLTINGERLCEVDLRSTYWTLLVGQLWDGDERDRAVTAIRMGRWYELLAAEAGLSPDDRGRLKVQTQIQCLFWRDGHPDSSRPLWLALRRLYPVLARLILSVRERAGATGLSDYLTWLESQVMYPVYETLAAKGVPHLPLHDAVLVGRSHVKLATNLLRKIGEERIGFLPAIKIAPSLPC